MLTKLEFTEAVPLTSGVKSGGEYTLSWDPQGLPETWTEGSIKLIDLHTDRILSLKPVSTFSKRMEEAVHPIQIRNQKSPQANLLAQNVTLRAA